MTVTDWDEDRVERDEAARARRQEDRDDFIRERAGHQVAKMNRFIRPGEAPDARAAAQVARDRDLWATMWTVSQVEMQRVRDRIADLERASLEALEQAERRHRAAEEHLERLREQAAVDRLGRRVYRAADGRVFYEDATELTAAEAAGIPWKPGNTSWEAHQDAVRRQNEAIAERDAIIRHRERLEHARDRIDSGEDLSPDELAELEEGIEAMPAAVRARLDAQEPRTSAAREYVDRNGPVESSTSDAFRRAGRGEPVRAPNPADPALAPPAPQR